MTFEKIFSMATVGLIAACALFVEAAPVVQAQMRVIAGSATIKSGKPHVAAAERIVLHGVRFPARSAKIDRCSIPVLDYAAHIIRQNPESLIYLKVHFENRSQEYTSSNSELANRRAQAVASYFERRGVSANRLILVDSGGTPYISGKVAEKAQSPKQNLEVVQLDIASELD
jgi:outer membrane protein OmpA-like peptidoglycan-associated protein